MKWLAVLFGLFIVTIIILADANLLGPLRAVYNFPYGDKAGHFVLYGLLTFVLDLAFLAKPHADSKRRILFIGLTLAALIGLEEWSQSRFPSRTMDIVDLSFSYAGVIIFSWIAYRIKK